MNDTGMIAASALAFTSLTWLLALSYALGRYAARTDALEHSQAENRETTAKIFDRLERLGAIGPHVCTQQARIAVIEERQTAILRQLGHVET